MPADVTLADLFTIKSVLARKYATELVYKWKRDNNLPYLSPEKTRDLEARIVDALEEAYNQGYNEG